MCALSNIEKGSAVLGIIQLNRKEKEEQQISVPAAISCYLGVTEPAMFGINLKYQFPFIAAMIGSGVAGIMSVGMGLMANSVGVGGLPGFLSFNLPDYWRFFLIAAVAIVIPFILTVVVGRKRGYGQ